MNDSNGVLNAFVLLLFGVVSHLLCIPRMLRAAFALIKNFFQKHVPLFLYTGRVLQWYYGMAHIVCLSGIGSLVSSLTSNLFHLGEPFLVL